jgi:inner membrane protein
MSPLTHALVGWTVANVAPLTRRERALVMLASIVSDIDGLGILMDLATRYAVNPTSWYEHYHHMLGHNLGFALVLTTLAFVLAHQRTLVAALSFLSVHLHLLGDLVGSRGPDGYQWPMPSLVPWSAMWQLAWQGQWALNAWPNLLLTGILLAAMFYLAWQRGYSPVEILSTKADAVFIATLRARFGAPGTAPTRQSPGAHTERDCRKSPILAFS